LWPIDAVPPQLGCQLWVGKQVLKLPLERDETELFPFLALNEPHRVASWALVHLFEVATVHATIVHARANHLWLWDGHVTQDLGWCRATVTARQYRRHQLARRIKRPLLFQGQASMGG